MDYYLTEQQVEELVNFDHVYENLEDLIQDEQKFDMNEYLKSNIDYWYETIWNPVSTSWSSWFLEKAIFYIH